MKFVTLPITAQQNYIRILSNETGLDPQIIEKDWWVTTVLRALFALPYADALSFKGGTSLSKCWNLIERFSEDVDIAVSREYLGFSGTLSKTQVSDKLRRAACTFVREKLQYDLENKMIEQGVPHELFTINVNITPVTTTDPEKIEVHYHTNFEQGSYVKNTVIIEVSGRSMSEPLEQVDLKSLLENHFADAPFIESSVRVNAVLPERTFLEKICLLHEEFSNIPTAMRVERMSRHLYDIIQICKTDISKRALEDVELFRSIVEHRKNFIGLKGFDYSTLTPATLNIVPPSNVIAEWKKDYERMQESMIYGESLPFDKLIEQITELNRQINQM